MFVVCRKHDLRELKMLQKQENKQITDLLYKNQNILEAKEKKFEADRVVRLFNFYFILFLEHKSLLKKNKTLSAL